MGYSGLASWNDVDDAAGTAYRISVDIVKHLKKALREKGNGVNPSGAVNVSLLNESFILPIVKNFKYLVGEELTEVLNDAYDKLASETIHAKSQSVEEWRTAANKKMHITAYTRLLKKLEKSISALG